MSHPRHSIINLSHCVFKYPPGYMSHPRHLNINLSHCVFKYPSGYTSHPRHLLFTQVPLDVGLPIELVRCKYPFGAHVPPLPLNYLPLRLCVQIPVRVHGPTLATQLLTFFIVCSNTRQGTRPTLATQLLTYPIVCIQISVRVHVFTLPHGCARKIHQALI